tara:strand:- start:7821 stop:8693 length:873 start_codon:yes stop_codon:yes gene_type:complete
MIKISIVVPVFNMFNTIEQTLNSIWQQNYSNLELIVIDGGSTDGTYNFLKENKNKIDFLVSENDNGQYHAIQKGFDLASGEIISWINADDVYFPWTLKTVNDVFSKWEDVNWIIGLASFLNSEGNLTNISSLSSKNSKHIYKGRFRKNVFGYLQQESMFYRKKILDNAGGLNLNFSLAADFELWTRFAKNNVLYSLNLPIAAFRKTKNSRSKKMESVYLDEVKIIIKDKFIYKLINYCSQKSKVFNFLIRSLLYKKSHVIYYSRNSQKLKRKKLLLSFNSISLSNLFLEI